LRALHFDPFSGISGDMTLGALFDAGVPTEPVLDGIASLGLPIQLKVEKVRKGGFAATCVKVEAPQEHKHRHLHHIEAIINQGKLSERQRDLAQRIFRKLGEAEAAAHGIELKKVHFHEVGALDSIADIVGAAIALDLLGAEKVTSGPVATGSGMVQCEHGLMPIPAPGTAQLLKGVPLRPSSIQAELTTPTGAAILTTVVDEYVDTPPLTIERIGQGAGTKDFAEQPNILRILVGERRALGREPQGSLALEQGTQPLGLTPQGSPMFLPGVERDAVYLLETNLDDVPAEVIGYCFDQLLAAGALDVYTTPITMKKNRPGVLFSVLAEPANLAGLEDILFRETGTLGIRRVLMERDKLQRKPVTVETPWGTVRGKLAWRDGQQATFSPEFDDCARIARERGVALQTVCDQARSAYKNK
jgi:uncharacterized protein (TIGR00299 family) protein